MTLPIAPLDLEAVEAICVPPIDYGKLSLLLTEMIPAMTAELRQFRAQGETKEPAAPASPKALESLVVYLEEQITSGHVTEIDLTDKLMDLVAEARRMLVLPSAIPEAP